MTAKTKIRVLVIAADEVDVEWKGLFRLFRELNRSMTPQFGVSLKISRLNSDRQKRLEENTSDHRLTGALQLGDCDILIGVFWKSFPAFAKLDQYKASIESKHPRVVFLFKQLPYIPISRNDAQQWVEMLKFRQSFPAARVWWPYQDVAQLTTLVREQTTQHLFDSFPLSGKVARALGPAADNRESRARVSDKSPREQRAVSLREALKSPHSDPDSNTASEDQGPKEDISDKWIREQTVNALIEALKSPHNSIRWAALDELGRTKSENAVKAMASLLSDRDGNTRLKAVELLGVIGGHHAATELSAALKSNHSDVRRRAAMLLKSVGGPQVLPSLIAAFRQGNNDIRRFAAQALGRIGGGRAFWVLTRALKDVNRDVRRDAVDGLEEMSGKKAIVALTRAVADKDREVRLSALEVLVTLSGKPTLKRLNMTDGEEALSGLCKAIRFPHSDVRQRVAEALAPFRSKRVLSALIKASKDESPEVRGQAVEALRNFEASDQAVTALIRALRDESSEVRSKSATALARMHSSKSTAVRLYGELKAPQSSTLRDATRVVSALIRASKDGVPKVRRSAIDALGSIGGQRAVEALIDALRFHHGDIRLRAAEALGKIGNENAVGALVSAFQDIGREKALEESGAYIAHEVRSAIGPLRIIAKELNRTLRESRVKKRVLVEIVDSVIAQTDEVYLLVDLYVDYTKPLSPKQKSTDLNQLIKSTLKEINAECAMRSISISKNLQNTARIQVDPMLIVQALRNILRNAVEAIGDNGEVMITTRAERDHVIISITDTGPGIQPKNLARIFELGFTTKIGKQGTGLGLKLARRIVEEAHNGQLLVENNPHRRGAVVTIKLTLDAERL